MNVPSLETIREDWLDGADVELGPAGDPDEITGICGGDVCPYCGDALRYDDEAIRSDGTRGKALDLAPDDVSVPLFCPGCWQEVVAARRGVENRSIEDYSGGSA